ncbi:glycosyltransferase family 2 protein [Haloferax sp. AS1]|uniref:glycosyltransferase family 2 protein n=1 Tax=Haloferax sp. AS1 TaxID=2562277 RepID=UPI00165FD62D|nr:glycosyltransferase family 2 protein [Haloferax sp. AS1]MBC9986801.1 glycosyltransferase family 2 protein [Haloferax sp. AS1]
MESLTVCTPTYNDVDTVHRALSSIENIADEIVVLDSFSDDGTREIVSRYNQSVIYDYEFEGFADLFRTAASKASNKWVLFVDADEEVRNGLRSEIKNVLKSPTKDAYQTTKCNRMWGKWMHTQHKPRPILARKDALQWDDALVGEEWLVQEGYDTGTLSNPIHHYAYDSIDEYIEKWMRYTSADALTEVRQNSKPSVIYFYLKGVLAVAYRYLWERAILDGWQGAFFSLMSGVFYVVVDAKMRQINSIKKNHDDWEEWWIENKL